MLRKAEPIIKARLDGDMIWAAVTLAVNAALRPGEFLGDTAGRDRWIKPSWIHFFSDASCEVPFDPQAGAPPRAMTVRLAGGAKRDQAGSAPPLRLAWPPAVLAMHEWLQARGRHESNIFTFRQGRALTKTALFPILEDALRQTHDGPCHVRGKSFRQGFASGALEKGIDTPRILAHGRWKQAATMARYASDRALAIRAAQAAGSL